MESVSAGNTEYVLTMRSSQSQADSSSAFSSPVSAIAQSSTPFSPYSCSSRESTAGNTLGTISLSLSLSLPFSPKTHITQVHPPTRATTPSTALITRAPRAPRVRISLPAPAPEPKPPRRGKGLRRGPEVVVQVRAGGQDLVEDGEEPMVLGEGARRGRELGGRPDREVWVGRVCGEVGEEMGGCRERVGKDFLARRRRGGKTLVTQFSKS